MVWRRAQCDGSSERKSQQGTKAHLFPAMGLTFSQKKKAGRSRAAGIEMVVYRVTSRFPNLITLPLQTQTHNLGPKLRPIIHPHTPIRLHQIAVERLPILLLRRERLIRPRNDITPAHASVLIRRRNSILIELGTRLDTV